MTESRVARTAMIQDAVSKVRALRKITKESACITKRAQSKVLQTLTDEELTIVAELLAGPCCHASVCGPTCDCVEKLIDVEAARG